MHVSRSSFIMKVLMKVLCFESRPDLNCSNVAAFAIPALRAASRTAFCSTGFVKMMPVSQR